MKYTESYKGRDKKFGPGFYILIACCLLIIGAVAWFALSRIDETKTKPKLNSSDYNNSYSEDTSSYNENAQESEMPEIPSMPEITDSVAQSVSDEPYSDESTSNTEQSSFTMPVAGDIIKDYSITQLQYSSTYGDMRIHNGIDIACENGTSVSTCASGTVESIELNTTFGNVVTINHGNGIIIRYASLDDIKVEKGSKVSMGDIIGKAATIPAECNDKSHIHIEVLKDNKYVSPLKTLGF